MKRSALLLLAVAASPPAADAQAWADPDAAHAEVRTQLLSEFKYEPVQKGRPPSSPVLAHPLKSALVDVPVAAPDVVRMEPYTVRDSLRMEALRADLLQQKADAKTAMVMDRLGIGVHAAQVGPAVAYVATVFYIPFTAGISLSW